MLFAQLPMSSASHRHAVSCVLAALLSSGACGDPPGPTPVLQVPEDRDPAWSPDGQWLAFEHTGSDTTPGLYIARIDGTERRLLVAGPMVPGDWSPDGSAIVFTVGFAYQISRIDLATDSILALTTEGFNVGPAWSPDGRTIAYNSDGNQRYPTDLWLMDANGGSPRRVPLGTPPTSGYGEMDWAPTGDQLVASAVWRTGTTTFIHRLLVVDTAGRDTAWITPLVSEARQPAWSPTGEWIAYVRAPGPQAEVRLVRPDGSDDHLLTRNGFYPTWSPNGQRVAFTQWRPDEAAVWSVDLTGGDPKQLSWPSGPPSARVLSARASPPK